MQVVNWVGPSITTPVSTVTVSRTTTVRPVTISLVLVRSVVTKVNPYLGFEMGYDWLGRMAYKGSVDNGAFKAQGVQLTAKLGYRSLTIWTSTPVWAAWFGALTPKATTLLPAFP